ncbi:MAG TPA: tRNA preQ1(34) S-adenosylmethionine ribosyltransferase-isomerase QueA, partial [Phycisphaerales bacterium]|nr:tRNA preQ1(34) S-adenosylmethionine ribosyltransferase-isomerase QueA [Phycisphaerales bacterium]
AVRARGGRVVSVGTTSCRTLESLPDPLPNATIEASTDLLIAPGHVFTRVDALMTNFHLPRSTLLALVAAMIGLESTRRIYHEAVEARYRFYSYGDAMLIL